MAQPAVVSLSDFRALDVALTGGKGANLARMMGAGMPVPDGFCVTTAVFDALTDDEEIRAGVAALRHVDASDAAGVAHIGQRLRHLVTHRPVGDDAVRAIVEAATALGAPAVAVRSSATVEDLPTASVAGQHDTLLNVSGDDALVDAVRACMASAFSDRAITYRTRNGIPHEGVGLAVVVQRQLEPFASGILFTADPDSGDRRVTVIDAAFGLGAALVSGHVDPDHARLDGRSGDVTYTVADKRTALRPDPAGGTRTVVLGPAQRRARVLTDHQVRQLADLGEQAASLFACPQDVEWAIVHGHLVALQSRPITTLFPVPTPAPTDGRLHVYVSLGHLQAQPQAMPPLARDVFATFYEPVLDEMGLGALSSRWMAEAGGRSYFDVTPLLRLRRLREHVPGWFAAINMPTAIGLADLLQRRGEAFADPIPGAMRGFLRAQAWAGAGVIVAVPRMVVALLRTLFGPPLDPRVEQRRWERFGLRAAHRISGSGDATERARAILDPDPATLRRAFPLATMLPMETSLLLGFGVGSYLDRRFADAPQDTDGVSAGFPDEIVTRINQGLGDLADLARAHPAVADALRSGASAEEVAAVEGGDVFAAALDRYLDEFGHRGTGELDPSRPRWRDDPTVLLRVVAANLATQQPGEHRAHLRRLQDAAAEAAERLERRAGRGLLGPLRRRVIRRLIRLYRANIQLREHPKHGSAHLFAVWHDVLQTAGGLLAARGLIPRADDVWLLRRHEVLAALDGAPPHVDLAERRAELQRHGALTPPEVITSEGEIPRTAQPRTDVPAGALVGTPVSGGVAEGPARVVLDPATESLHPGEILVAPACDPGWTPLFLNAAGLVTEVGGRVSHGALVAREYGLPAVASVPDATRLLRTGQRLRVDGTAGIVEVLSDDLSGVEQAVDDELGAAVGGEAPR